MGLPLNRQNAFFIGLLDTPNDFTGEALKAVRVRADELKLEFFETGYIPLGTIIGQTTVWDGNDWILNNRITDDGTDINITATDSTKSTGSNTDVDSHVVESKEVDVGIDRLSYFEVTYLRTKMFSIDNITGYFGEHHIEPNLSRITTSDGVNYITLEQAHDYLIAENYELAKITDPKSLITLEHFDAYTLVQDNLFCDYTHLGRTSRALTGIDLDDIQESGDYVIKGGCTNGPPDGIFLIVQQEYENPPPPAPTISDVIQTVHTPFDIYTRYQDSTGTWSDWKSMTTPELISLNAATYTTLLTTGGKTIIHSIYSATGTSTVTLGSPASTKVGKIYLIKDAGGNAGTFNITVDTQGAETIDGQASWIINGNYDWLEVYSDGNNWFIKG